MMNNPDCDKCSAEMEMEDNAILLLSCLGTVLVKLLECPECGFEKAVKTNAD